MSRSESWTHTWSLRNPSALFPAAPPPTPDQGEAARAAELVQVTSRKDRVDIRLTFSPGSRTDLAAAQLICTAVAAQRLAAPASDPLPVTVTDPDGLDVGKAGTPCPDA